MAILALIPIRYWLYGGLLAVLLAFGLHYRSLEKQEHAARVVAEQAIADVKKVDAAAQATETQSALIYKEIVRVPDVPDVGIVCRNTSRGALPAASPVTGADAGKPAADDRTAIEYDPSGAALTVARSADAQIRYLQSRIKELENQMNGAP